MTTLEMKSIVLAKIEEMKSKQPRYVSFVGSDITGKTIMSEAPFWKILELFKWSLLQTCEKCGDTGWIQPLQLNARFNRECPCRRVPELIEPAYKALIGEK